MKSSTGRWVSGDNFFDREPELAILGRLVRAGNHVLLTGQRRMGKTSLLRELGRQLEDEDWIFLFSDIEGATSPEDVVAEIARAAHPVRPVARRMARAMGRFFDERIDEISALEFGVKIRAGLDAGSWKRHGEDLLRHCAAEPRPSLLVIDELPIFLKRLLSRDGGAYQVEEFLSWLRGVLQDLGDDTLVVVVSGSVGLEPLVRRLGIPDRINHFYSYRLGPWDRATSVECFGRLADSHGISAENGVSEAVYDALGIGIPHHIQSFFARLCDFIAIRRRNRITVADVETVYRTELLGPSGQSALAHYETRLREALGEESCTIALWVLAEAAVRGVFTGAARRQLEVAYSAIIDDAAERIAEAMEVLEHDGYLTVDDGGHSIPSRLLKDWWAARFRNHYVPLDGGDAGDDPHETRP